MNELEQRKLKYDIVFYHMEGCYYCRMANDELDPLIKAGIIPASGQCHTVLMFLSRYSMFLLIVMLH
jgi:hypothetical protein